jgi:hypothetical protein
MHSLRDVYLSLETAKDIAVDLGIIDIIAASLGEAKRVGDAVAMVKVIRSLSLKVPSYLMIDRYIDVYVTIPHLILQSLEKKTLFIKKGVVNSIFALLEKKEFEQETLLSESLLTITALISNNGKCVANTHELILCMHVFSNNIIHNVIK